jgi:hypothetical protein
VRHVPFLSWQKADEVVTASGTLGEAEVWSIFWAERDASLHPQAGRDMLLRGDRATLLRSAFAEPPHPAQAFRVTIILFSVVEALKNRRRLIGWPRAFNAAERRILRGLRARHIVVPFARAAIAAGRVNMAFFAIADFVKYFQQFAIDATVRRFYSFVVDGELLCLTTAPSSTGSLFSACALSYPTHSTYQQRACLVILEFASRNESDDEIHSRM